jgi:hypothetical protein
MITYIIPLINPDHPNLSSYNDVELWLEKTLHSIKKQTGKNQVIVVCHKKPDNYRLWERRNVVFICVDSPLFKFLMTLDSGVSISNDSSFNNLGIYSTYLSLSGEFHNKDKGIKYFIGLLYCFLQQKQPQFVGLIDGDDYLHTELASWLHQEAPKNANLFAIDVGYLVFSNGIDTPESKRLNITGCYKLNNFSQLCGTNRFFRYPFLKQKLKRRLSYSFPPEMLSRFKETRIFGRSLVALICQQINSRPEAWSILPMFLGNHRLLRVKNSSEPPHRFQYQFIISRIPFPAAIKFVHNTNHSCNSREDLQIDIISRYRQSKLIIGDIDGLDDFFPIAKLFAIGPYTYTKRTIQNSP